MALPFTKKLDTWGQWGRECFFCCLVFKLYACISVRLVIEAQFLSLRTLGICCLVLLAGGVSIMSRLLCLKMLPLQCQCQISACFHWLIHTTVVFGAMGVVDFRGKACLSESNTFEKLVSFLKHRLCVATLVGLRCPKLTSLPLHSVLPQQAAKSYKSV